MEPGERVNELQALSVDFYYETVSDLKIGKANMDIPVIKDVADIVGGYDERNGNHYDVEHTPAFFDVERYIKAAMTLQGLHFLKITAAERMGRWADG